MNPRELKNHLHRLVKKNGKSSITKLEHEYMTGKIDFNTYLNRCYADYVNGDLSKK
jgi:ABC-type maltose transport system permease subunit